MTARHIHYWFVGTEQELQKRFRHVQVEPRQIHHITGPEKLAGRIISPWDQVVFGPSFRRWDGDRRNTLLNMIIACQVAGRRLDGAAEL